MEKFTITDIENIVLEYLHEQDNENAKFIWDFQLPKEPAPISDFIVLKVIH
jgi:hypothetical protein